MPASFENMQRGAAASERAGSGFNPGAPARGRNNQSEDRDALGAFTRRRLLRKCGTPQDAVRKMKVAEPIDIEFLQAERLQDFFAFHCRRPIPEVMEVSGHNWRVPYSKLFLRVDLESQLRTQRKINGWEMTRAPTPGAMRGRPVRCIHCARAISASPLMSASSAWSFSQPRPATLVCGTSGIAAENERAVVRGSTFEEPQRAGGRNAIDRLDGTAFSSAAGIS